MSEPINYETALEQAQGRLAKLSNENLTSEQRIAERALERDTEGFIAALMDAAALPTKLSGAALVAVEAELEVVREQKRAAEQEANEIHTRWAELNEHWYIRTREEKKTIRQLEGASGPANQKVKDLEAREEELLAEREKLLQESRPNW